MIPAQQFTQHASHQETVDTRTLRQVCGTFATGVTVITSGDRGNSVGVTANSFTSVSLDPPLVLFCLHKESRVRPVLTATGGFVVNFLAHHQEETAWGFAGRESARVDEVPHHRSRDGIPVLSQALAFLSCHLVREYDGGDHAILLGEVVDLGTSGRDEDPLVFYRGQMRVLGDGPTVGRS
ncbi:flavin reductase family protein [Nocardiopsis sp. YSL2]|uniref:flavin reductase family protein n=1 Tax=Nocardiopsis sp. YSL2 TaxID=2939492 RepID=UPI0026F43A19|nr:flavin reductase family protein [Nocardiopsis sp. YSL2]